jgi:hypothetical protein
MVEIVISPLAKGNAYASTLNYTHSSNLKSLQELFNVPAPGGGFLADANTPGTNDLWDMFKFSPTITSTASPAVAPISPSGATLSDSAGLANASTETGDAITGNLVFTLTGPNGFSYTQSDPINGNATYSASTTLPSGATPGTYTWSVSYAGDANNFSATDQGASAEQTTAVGPGATQVGNALYLVGGNTNDQVNVTPTSTGVNVNVKLGGVNVNNQSFTGVTTIYVYGYNGNDNIQVAPSLTIATVVSEGNGNDNIQLGNGTNTVSINGNGNDHVQLGDGAGNTVSIVGNGNDQVQAGNGAGNYVSIVGNGNVQVQAGNGTGNNVSITGNGNNQVQLGDGSNDSVIITGNGNDHAQVGDGNNDSVSITGNGNDQIQAGNGLDDFVSMVGNGNDDIHTGNGSGQAHVAGSGHQNVHLGIGWTQI